ncbi:MAG TPA: hypothetical protein ENN81_07665 [Phycisphaerales bacterium]|nr:hypothetical protein [Phycisphaerales bacterium]
MIPTQSKPADTTTDQEPSPWYTRHGFTGLHPVGQLAFVAIALAVAAVVWFAWAKGDFTAPSGDAETFLDSFRDWLLGLAKMVAPPLAVAYAAHFFLPKRRFYRQQFFCAECGRLLGFAITRCPRMECGSNKYTTDPDLAKRRAHLWETRSK